jgi:hypothetical protein
MPAVVVVGTIVVESAVVGFAVVGSTVVGCTVVGSAVVGAAVVGATVVGAIEFSSIQSIYVFTFVYTPGRSGLAQSLPHDTMPASFSLQTKGLPSSP